MHERTDHEYETAEISAQKNNKKISIEFECDNLFLTKKWKH